MNSDVLIEIEECIERNDIENALSLILANESKYENNAHFWNLKGVLCFNVDERDTAISCFSKAVELDPDYQEAIENLKYIRNLRQDNISEDLSILTDKN